MKKTIIDLFEDSVVKYGAKTFLLEKKHRAFEPTTYAETKEQALEIGAGLAADHGVVDAVDGGDAARDRASGIDQHLKSSLRAVGKDFQRGDLDDAAKGGAQPGGFDVEGGKARFGNGERHGAPPFCSVEADGPKRAVRKSLVHKRALCQVSA